MHMLTTRCALLTKRTRYNICLWCVEAVARREHERRRYERARARGREVFSAHGAATEVNPKADRPGSCRFGVSDRFAVDYREGCWRRPTNRCCSEGSQEQCASTDSPTREQCRFAIASSAGANRAGHAKQEKCVLQHCKSSLRSAYSSNLQFPEYSSRFRFRYKHSKCAAPVAQTMR